MAEVDDKSWDFELTPYNFTGDSFPKNMA